MFPIYDLPDGAANSQEQLGTKPKFWFEDAVLGKCLFKEGRSPITGDDWSEKIASELCVLLDLPHADYHLASWRNRRGIISPLFVPSGGIMIHGNELLPRVIKGYTGGKSFHVRQHTVSAVLAVLSHKSIQTPIAWQSSDGITSAEDVFVGYLLLDAWIANQDRHHENWALIATSPETLHLAPTYDHASSFGANETDETREERLRTRDRNRAMERYVEKASSAFYSSVSQSKKPMSPIDAFRTAGNYSPKAAQAWLKRLAQISIAEIEQIFNMIPTERISPIGIEFSFKLLELNRNRLLALLGA